jgi:ribA/ribD-fused uncharacterized protein
MHDCLKLEMCIVYTSNTMTEVKSEIDASIANDREYVFFFASKSPFSQWHPCKFTSDSGITYNSCEQWMMYCKAKLFGDMVTAGKILATDNQKTIKDLGRQVANYDETRWRQMRETIVFEGNLLKFRQNAKLLDALLATDGKKLVEASPWDRIWGIGISEEVARVTPARDWPGENLLGKTLDRVRHRLLFIHRMATVPQICE